MSRTITLIPELADAYFDTECRWYTKLFPELRAYIRSFLHIPAHVSLAVTCTRAQAEDPQHIELPELLATICEHVEFAHPGQSHGLFAKPVRYGLLNLLPEYRWEVMFMTTLGNRAADLYIIELTCFPIGPWRGWGAMVNRLGGISLTAIKASLTAPSKRSAPWFLSATAQDATLRETYPELFDEVLRRAFMEL